MNNKDNDHHIFLSPHPDDAIWSCGGRISELIKSGNKVTVITIFDGDTPLNYKYEKWRLIASPRLRRLENQSALKTLGANHISLGFVDAALRAKNGSPLYPTPDHLFSIIHPNDELLLEKIIDSLKNLSFGSNINAPLSLGGHIDHCLLHRACLQAFPNIVTWYEDFPYNLKYSIFIKELNPIWYSVNLKNWIKASLCYRSQIIYIFQNTEKFSRKLIQYASKCGQENGMEYAERGWYKNMILND